MSTQDPRKILELLYARNDIESKRSLRQFLLRSKIDSRPEPQPLENLIEAWQVADMDRMVPIIETVTGHRTDYNGPMLCWSGMPKGHNKSSGLASLLNGVLAYSKKRGLRLYCAAKDAEQAGLIRDFMWKLAEINPWYKAKLNFKTKLVEGVDNGSVLEILAADASGAQGKNPDLIIADELTAWDDRGQNLWNALFTSVGKRVVHGKMHCACMVLTNAGYRGTWQEQLRNSAESDPMWSFYEAPQGRTLASWMTPSILDQLKKSVSPSEAKRLYSNIWVDLTEDRGAFRPEDVDNCIGNPLPVPPGGTAVIGIDFGGVCDRTALCVSWFDGQRIHIPTLVCWQGTKEKEIKVSAVSEWIEKQLKKYKKRVLVFDVHQLLETVQRLEDRGENVVRFNFQAGKNNVQMLSHLRTLLSNKKLVFAEDAGYLNDETLATELKTVITKVLRFGERFDHESGRHDDRCVAVGMACMEAIKYPPTVPMVLGKQTTQPPLRDQVGSIFSQDHISRRGLFGT